MPVSSSVSHLSPYATNVSGSASSGLLKVESAVSGGRSRSGSKVELPELRIDTESRSSNAATSQAASSDLVNRAKEISRQIASRLAGARRVEAEETARLVSIEGELQDRLKDITAHVKGLRQVKEQVEELTRVLSQENDRTLSEFSVKLDKIEVFREELVVVDDLEKRLRDSAAKVEDFKARLEDVRQAIDAEKQRQLEIERRTITRRGILWSCVSAGAAVFVALYVLHVYSVYSKS